MNHLSSETSLYLRQHATNPVDWYPWGPEALARARELDRAIFLSIGYSACHWCHVMEHECFESPAIAALMNESFVCIKVDREERPDIDTIYMQAVQLMNHGQGGWPLSVFLTPELKPFYGGTYFPPNDAFGRPGFPTILRAIADAWKNRRDELETGAKMVVEHVALTLRARGDGEATLDESAIRRAVDDFAARFDARNGGTKGAPKFPPSLALPLLLCAHARFGDERALDMATLTLEKMARGGMYDQLAGGFHRYSVDDHWAVPHFEKMLYDNALLLRAYSQAFATTGREEFRRIASEIVEYVAREMTRPGGGFYAAQDADSDGEEGKFFAWTPAEVHEVVGEADADFAMRALGVSEAGNFEDDRTVLWRPYTMDELSKQEHSAAEEAATRFERVRNALWKSRESRVKPQRDEKTLTSWNGLMIAGMVEAARSTDGGDRPLGLARQAADFLLANVMRPDGRVHAVWAEGKAKLDGYLDCHAFFAWGLLELAAATGDLKYFHAARDIAAAMEKHFADPEGGYFFTANDHEQLVIRSQDPTDSSVPSGNAVAALVNSMLFDWTGEQRYRDTAERTLKAFALMATQYPAAFAMWHFALDRMLCEPESVVVVGSDEAANRLLRKCFMCGFAPHRLVIGCAKPADDPAILKGKTLVGGRSAAYVCRGFTCDAPIREVRELGRVLGGK